MAELCVGEAVESEWGEFWMGVDAAFSTGEVGETAVLPVVPVAAAGLEGSPDGEPPAPGIADMEFGAPVGAAIFRGDVSDGTAALGVAGCSACRSCSRRRWLKNESRSAMTRRITAKRPHGSGRE